jgi:nitroreductase
MNEEFHNDLARLIQTRRSIRAFLPQPVEQSLMEKVFELANHAPSNSNTQPWKACVVSGAAREQLGIGEEWKLMFGLSFGYEDTSKPENKIVPARASVAETTTFID